jgi:hypothetical protein
MQKYFLIRLLILKINALSKINVEEGKYYFGNIVLGNTVYSDQLLSKVVA